MTVDELNILHKKAETRRDGVYSFRGNLWAVKNNRFLAYVKPSGEVLQRMGCFDALIGNIEKSWDRKKKLKEWLTKQK